jgi:uncharacterized protein (TIGR03000 family)
VERRYLRLVIIAFAVVVGMPRLAVVDRVAPSWRQTAVAPAASQIRSRFTIIVPQDDAELLVGGKATTGKGKSRDFQTPPLESGKTFEYTFTAKWRPNGYTMITRSKQVEFKAGDKVSVDLSRDEGNDRAEIRFVPTPPDVVWAMIELAGINENDVVYEPGCGDGRIVIAAVKAGARKGIGIDIDPARVAESKANAAAANVGDKVEIRLGDALDIKDLSNATVVFLYMGNEFDLLIRPILWKQLNVGARVVSHRFTMGDWKPDKTVSLSDFGDEEYELHLWTITNEIKEKIGQK